MKTPISIFFEEEIQPLVTPIIDWNEYHRNVSERNKLAPQINNKKIIWKKN